MAITAAVTVNPSTVQERIPVTVTVTVTNTGATAVTVTNVQMSAVKTGDVAHQTFPGNFGAPAIGTGLNVTVAGSSGTLAIPVGFVAFVGTTGPIGGGSGTVTLGALVTTSDGSVTTASTTTLTVNSLASTYAAVEQTSAQPVAYP